MHHCGAICGGLETCCGGAGCLTERLAPTGGVHYNGCAFINGGYREEDADDDRRRYQEACIDLMGQEKLRQNDAPKETTQ